jgi:hypothetical protein
MQLYGTVRIARSLGIDKDEARETWRLFVPHLISVGAGKKLAGA